MSDWGEAQEYCQGCGALTEDCEAMQICASMVREWLAPGLEAPEEEHVTTQNETKVA